MKWYYCYNFNKKTENLARHRFENLKKEKIKTEQELAKTQELLRRVALKQRQITKAKNILLPTLKTAKRFGSKK